MRESSRKSELKIKNRLILLGTFDGVHLGHGQLLHRFRALAARWRLRPRLLIFDKPPRFYFSPPTTPSLLTTRSERTEILKSMGFLDLHFLRFGKRWSEMDRENFLNQILVYRYHCGGLIVGADFAFGKNRLGDIHWLEGQCKVKKIRLQTYALVGSDGQKISSTRIRNLLLNGEVEEAARLLTRPYFIIGKVVRGQGIGKQLGYPTANLRIDPEKLLPRGVYRVQVSEPHWKQARIAVCNIGRRPTLRNAGALRVEAHIPGFSGNLYRRFLKVEFLSKIRDEEKFKSLAALREQIGKDVRSCFKR